MILRCLTAIYGSLLLSACGDNNSEVDSSFRLPPQLAGGYIALDLLPAATREKAKELLNDPKYDDWRVYDEYPDRARGNYSQGMFSERGLAFAFREICAMDKPIHVRPVVGDLKISHFSYDLGMMDLWSQSTFITAPQHIGELRASIEQAWQQKYMIHEGRDHWELKSTSLPPRTETDSLGYVWSGASFKMTLTNLSSGGYHTLAVQMDPQSGLVRLTHCEMDEAN